MYYQVKDKLIHLSMLVKPNAKNTRFLGIENNCLQIALHARAKDNEANFALIDFLAELLPTTKSQIRFVRGNTSRTKVVSLPFSPALIKALEQLGLTPPGPGE
jgi:uncharacterized protein YggU (UPF0235/DUF167 family)